MMHDEFLTLNPYLDDFIATTTNNMPCQKSTAFSMHRYCLPLVHGTKKLTLHYLKHFNPSLVTKKIH